MKSFDANGRCEVLFRLTAMEIFGLLLELIRLNVL